MQDHYQILRLERSASPRQIKRAYRELCKQYTRITISRLRQTGVCRSLTRPIGFCPHQ